MAKQKKSKGKSNKIPQTEAKQQNRGKIPQTEAKYLVSEYLISEYLISEYMISEYLISEYLISECIISEYLISRYLISWLPDSGYQILDFMQIILTVWQRGSGSQDLVTKIW